MARLQIIAMECVFSKYFFLKYLLLLMLHSNINVQIIHNRIPCKHGDNSATPPSSKIMPKHDENSGDTGKKNTGGLLGLVCIVLKQRPEKSTSNK